MRFFDGIVHLFLIVGEYLNPVPVRIATVRELVLRQILVEAPDFCVVIPAAFVDGLGQALNIRIDNTEMEEAGPVLIDYGRIV
jgi:hypothetical protein